MLCRSRLRYSLDMRLPSCVVFVLLALTSDLHAQPSTSLREMKWNVNTEERTGLVHLPVLDKGLQAPLVFVWHGHGGSSRGAARQFRIHQHWPTAIVVYPQGLPTPAKLVDPKGLRSGWQSDGDAKTNRDLLFFDVMLEDLVARGIVDADLVFSTGHSNGGGFTYNLLVERGKRLAAIAPSAHPLPSQHRYRAFPKIPVFHVAGRNDRLVKMEWQQATIDHLLRFYDCEPPKQWDGRSDCLEYASKEGHILVTYVHPGTHKMPADAGALITSFFQSQAELVRMRPRNTHPSNGDPKQALERPSQHSMVYELRTYTAADGKLDALESRFRDHTMNLFERHGMKNIAYWIPVDVPNTLIYVLAHHDRDAAKKSWQSFVNDQDWQRIFKASRVDGPLVVRIESVFMKATDYSPMP